MVARSDMTPGIAELEDDLDVFASTGNPLQAKPVLDAERLARPDAASRKDEDTNAAVCPDWNTRARRLLITPENKETHVMKMMPYAALTCFLGLAMICFWFIEDLFALTTMDANLVVALFTMTPSMYAFTCVVPELFAVLLPGGELAALGVEQTKISTSALARLESQRKLTRLVQGISAFSAFFLSFMLIGTFVFFFSVRGFTVGLLDFLIMVPVALGTIWIMATALPLGCEFALALQVAAALASDEVLEIVHAVDSVSPADVAVWEATVVQPSLALANGAIHLLSKGWGRGLALLYVGTWSPAIGVLYAFSFQLMMVLASPSGGRVMMLLVMLGLALLLLGLPIAMSTAVAQVSTSCDDLGNAINQCRIQDLGHSERILALELALQNLNNRQGLGL
jgi:hypothetical protein